jgi:clathrin heavy chain
LSVSSKLFLFSVTLYTHSTASKPPVKVFDRAGRLAEGDIQIIHYTVDKSETWSLLVGIYSNDKKTVEGVLQLYSLERKQQQILQGYTGCFGSLMVSLSFLYFFFNEL